MSLSSIVLQMRFECEFAKSFLRPLWVSCFAIFAAHSARCEEIGASGILGNWEQRREKYHSVALTYDRSISELISSKTNGVDKQWVEYNDLLEFKINGEFVSFVRDGQITNENDEVTYTRHHTVNNGDLSGTAYSPKDQEFPSGFIYNDRATRIVGQLCTRAIRFLCFSHDPQVTQVEHDNLEVVNKDVSVGGSKCVLLEALERGGQVRKRLWVCPEMDYSVVQYQAIHRDKLRSQMLCDYTRAPSGHWLPSKIEYTQLVSGNPRMHQVLLLKSFDTDPQYADSDFELVFPGGSIVKDYRNSASSKRFLVRDDGSIRPILEAEYGASYSQIVATESGEAVAITTKARSGFSNALLWGNIIAVLLLIFLFARHGMFRRVHA